MEVDPMIWGLLAATAVGCWLGSWFGRTERIELDAEVLELRELNAELAMEAARFRHDWSETDAVIDAYLHGYMEGRRDEAEEHA
jgi:hypothetical protein